MNRCDPQEKELQKFLALTMWVKRARDWAYLGNRDRAKQALEMVEECLKDCWEVLNETS